MAMIKLETNTHAPNPFIKTELSKAYYSIPDRESFHKEWGLRNYDPQWCIDYAQAIKEKSG